MSESDVQKAMTAVEDATDAQAAEQAAAETQLEAKMDAEEPDEAVVEEKDGFAKSLERAATATKTELKAWAGKNSENLCSWITKPSANTSGPNRVFSNS